MDEMTGGFTDDGFPRACDIVLALEGGFSDDPRDVGGATNYGISSAAHPGADVSRLTAGGAEAIYRRDYWDANRCGEMPWPLALCLFDSAVQFAPPNPARWLQLALGVAPDGQIGPRTVAATRACEDPVAAAVTMMALRGEYRILRRNYPTYGRGWRKRDLTVMAEAARA